MPIDYTQLSHSIPFFSILNVDTDDDDCLFTNQNDDALCQ